MFFISVLLIPIILYLWLKRKVIYNKFKEALSSLLTNIIRFLKKILKKVKIDYETEDFLPLYSLNKLSEKQMKIKAKYFDSIRSGIEDNNVFNIGIIGAYGSGKSTIINVFKNEFPEFKYLSIELSDFESIKRNENVDTERMIEQSVLQQLIFSTNPKKVQRSRIKRINKSGLLNKIFFLTFSILALLSIGVLFGSSVLFSQDSLKLYQYIFNNEFLDYNEVTLLIIRFLSIAILFGILGYIVYKLYVKSDLFNISKIGISDVLSMTKFEDKKEESFLNRYIDEIIYHIDKGKYDVIIIEDLDRFQEKNVFFQLRKINNLINRNLKRSKKITFLYAVKDDIFTMQDRVKFFELIVPIIPELHFSNSGNVLLQFHRDKKFNLDCLSEDYLTDISVFIEERRLLNNICNEYFVYSETLMSNKGDNLDYEQLFALIIYKNLYPYDFHNLYKKTGIIYLLLKSADEINDKRSGNLASQVEEIENKIHVKKEWIVESEEELRSIYLAHLISNNPNIFQKNYGINGSSINFSKTTFKNYISDPDLFLKLYNSRRITNNGKNFYDIFRDYEKNKKNNYIERLKLINNNHELFKLKKDKEKVNKEILSINNYTLKEVFLAKENFHKIKTSFSIKYKKFYLDKKTKNKNENNKYDENFNIDSHPFFEFIMRRGYFKRHTYLDYMNYFYPGTLKYEEMNFVKRVKSGQKTNIHLDINNFNLVLSKFNSEDYNNGSILNLSLIESMINNQNRYETEIKSMMKIIGEEDNYNFVSGFLNYASEKSVVVFMKYLLGEWIDVGYHIENENKETLDKIIKLILVETETILINELISKYMKISNRIENIDFINEYTKDISNEKIIDLIKKNGIKFLNLKDINYDTKLSKYIYNNNYYKLNLIMIKSILDKYDDEEIFNKNYSLIMESNRDKLKNYINSEINFYTENVILRFENDIFEEEKYLLKLLNNYEIDKKIKIALIEKNRSTIENIDDVNDSDLWPSLIKEEILKVNWRNVNIVYSYSGPEEYLISYIRRNIDNFTKMSTNMYEDLSSKNLNIISLALFELLSADSLVKILDRLYLLDSVMENFNYSNIPTKNIELLIQESKIKLTQANLNNVSNEDIKFCLIKENLEIFIDSQLKIANNEIELVNKLISDEDFETKTRAELVLKRSYLLNNLIHIPIKVLKFIIENRISNNKNEIISLLTKQLKNIKTIDACLYFINLLGDEYKKIGTNKQARLSVNNASKLLLEELKNKNIVTSFSIKQTKKSGKHYRCYSHRHYEHEEFNKEFDDILKEYYEQ